MSKFPVVRGVWTSGCFFQFKGLDRCGITAALFRLRQPRRDGSDEHLRSGG